MVRLAVAVLGFVLLATAAYFAPYPGLAGLLPLAGVAPLFSAIALIVSLVAAVAALRALSRIGRLSDDIHILARSLDMALKALSARTDKDAATISDMGSAVSREIEKLSERITTTDDISTGARPAHADNVVPHPAARRPRVAGGLADASTPAPDHGAIEAAYRKAVAAGEFDISLQPIVSVSRGAAAGFEVFANLPVDGGQRVDLRRPAQRLPGTEAAVFERILVTTALQAGRRRLGAASTTMPLHVAVSEAILGSAAEIAPLLEMLQFYPDLAQAIVLSVPVGLLDAGGEHAQALRLLSGKGVRLAAEGWDETAGIAALNAVEGFCFLKIGANRLLDRDKPRRKSVPASTIIDSAEADGLLVVATDVANDEDAVSLIDLGLDLMAGPRFGAPKRLKPEGGNRPGRLALI